VNVERKKKDQKKYRTVILANESLCSPFFLTLSSFLFFIKQKVRKKKSKEKGKVKFIPTHTSGSFTVDKFDQGWVGYRYGGGGGGGEVECVVGGAAAE